MEHEMDRRAGIAGVVSEVKPVLSQHLNCLLPTVLAVHVHSVYILDTVYPILNIEKLSVSVSTFCTSG